MKQRIIAVLWRWMAVLFSLQVYGQPSTKLIPAQKPLDRQWYNSLYHDTVPATYRGAALTTIGMPVGGIAAGQLYIRGDGSLAGWWIANNAYNTGPGHENMNTFNTPLGQWKVVYQTFTPPSFISQGFRIKVSSGSKTSTRLLNKEGCNNISFSGEYPVATVQYDDTREKLPVSVRMQAFSPFIPLNARESATPGTYLVFTLRNTSKQKAVIALNGWLQNPVCLELKDQVSAFSRNRAHYAKGLRSLIMDAVATADSSGLNRHPYYGNMALSALSDRATVITDQASNTQEESRVALGKALTGEVSVPLELLPGQEKEVVFLLSWYFPNRPLDYGDGGNWNKPIAPNEPAIGNNYANWFSDAEDVASWLKAHRPRLTATTQRFVEAYYRSTLPYWLKHRLMMPVSTLATETCQWWANGKFYAWEGVGSCTGTCTHVWNYEQAMAYLFPELDRNLREQTDFANSFRADGAIMTRNGTDDVKIDGHAGGILKSYREHLSSGNDLFLSRNWKHIRKAISYLFSEDRKDGTLDGLLSAQQANTYDISFYGANTYVGGLYLAALKAGREMALLMQDPVMADSCEQLFRSGADLSVQRLWNGRYFIQEVDLQQHPKFQYADGCLSDQLFGQTWAHQLQLGYLYPPDKVKQALRSIWEYNFTTDAGAYNAVYPPERYYARGAEPGLLICTWPLSKHMGENGVRYRDEIWTGIEYQVAANMIAEGMLDEGLSLVKAVHQRYTPEKHNPWNEVECGDHYARALASWGVLLALEDYHYDGPKGKLAFAPKLQPEQFKGFFTAANGWGNLLQQRSSQRQVNEIVLGYGSLHLQELGLTLPENVQASKVVVMLNGEKLPVKWKSEGNVVTLTGLDAQLYADDRLKTEIAF